MLALPIVKSSLESFRCNFLIVLIQIVKNLVETKVKSVNQFYLEDGFSWRTDLLKIESLSTFLKISIKLKTSFNYLNTVTHAIYAEFYRKIVFYLFLIVLPSNIHSKIVQFIWSSYHPSRQLFYNVSLPQQLLMFTLRPMLIQLAPKLQFLEVDCNPTFPTNLLSFWWSTIYGLYCTVCYYL